MHTSIMQILALIGALSICATTFGSPSTEDNLLRALDGLQSLRGKHVAISGSYASYKVRDGQSSSEIKASYAFRTVFNPGDPSWLRIECASYKSPLEDKAGFFDRDVIFIYDTGRWFTLTSSARTQEGQFSVKECLVSDQKPDLLGGADDPEFQTGRGSVLAWLPFYRGSTVSEMVKRPKRDWRYSVDVTDEKVSASDLRSKVSLTYSMTQSGEIAAVPVSFVCEENIGAASLPIMRTEISFGEPIRTAIGLVPSRMERKCFVGKMLKNAAVVSITQCELVATADVPRDVTFEAGWTVHDEKLGVVYRTGQTVDDTLRSLRKVLGK